MSRNKNQKIRKMNLAEVQTAIKSHAGGDNSKHFQHLLKHEQTLKIEAQKHPNFGRKR